MCLEVLSTVDHDQLEREDGPVPVVIMIFAVVLAVALGLGGCLVARGTESDLRRAIGYLMIVCALPTLLIGLAIGAYEDEAEGRAAAVEHDLLGAVTAGP